MFVDEARVFASAGRGGNGAVSFHREKYRPKGGPDGGSGGRGGSVVLQANSGAGSLAWLSDHPHQRAEPGRPGSSNRRTGAEGEDLVLPVPVGTIVKADDRSILADLASAGDRAVVARGGRGGRGNAAFVSDARRAPGFAELGEPGEEAWIRLELALIADVAVIGYPNAGKSTLVGALSAARPKVADYPFTTLEPSLGVVEVGGGDAEPFTVCDIPGLIEGAHRGKGLGLAFLRHARRAAVFVHLVDLASGRDTLDDYRIVRRELGTFDPSLLDRPEMVALNKQDAVVSSAVQAALERLAAEGIEALPISAKEGSGLEALVARLHDLVLEARAGRRAKGFELFRTEPAGLAVSREGAGWRVRGPAVERWVAMCDLANPEGVAYLQARLERAGVETLLARAGAKEGDEVRIGAAVFEWWPSQRTQESRK